MKRIVGTSVFRKAISLTCITGLAGVMAYCKSTGSSALKEDFVIQKGATSPKVFDLGDGEYVIKFYNNGKIKSGDKLKLKYDVVQKWDQERIKCDSLKFSDDVVAKVDGLEVAITVKADPSKFSRCGTEADAKIDKNGRKIALSCQKSNDWNGPKTIEGCLFNDNNKLITGGRAAPTKLQSGLGLAELEEHVDTVLSMGKACAERLGPLPRDWSCLDGAIIPVTQNGKEVTTDCEEGDNTCILYTNWQPTDKCDNPAYLGLGDQGQCTPFSRLGRLYTKKDVELIFVCRRYKIGNKVLESVGGSPSEVSEHVGPDEPLHQDVAIVQHNIKTGETCYQQALSGFQPGQKDLPTARIPPPHETSVPDDIIAKYAHLPENQQPAAAPGFWITPTSAGQSPDGGGFQCIKCHDSDPFMHSPHVDQVNFDFNFEPSEAVRFAVNGHEGIKRTVANMTNTVATDEAGNQLRDLYFNFNVGKHPYAGRKDKMVPCSPGKKGNGIGEVRDPQCIFNHGEENSASGKYSQVHDVHQRTFPDVWAITPKDSEGKPDDTCVTCHRIGSINACSSWVEDSVGGTLINGSKSEAGKAFPASHWMPLTGKYPTDDFYNDYKNKKCKPDLENPGQYIGECGGSLEDWNQKFETARSRILACCNLAVGVGRNVDPSTSDEFNNQCFATKITSGAAHTGRNSDSIENLEIATNLSFKDGSTLPVRLESPKSGKVDYIGFSATLNHERCGDARIVLMKNNDRVVLFDGNTTYRNRPCRNVKIKIENADGNNGFEEIVGTANHDSDFWQIVLEDRFDNSSDGELDNAVLEVGIKN